MVTAIPRTRPVVRTQPQVESLASKTEERVYAIAFDMDTDTLQKSYPGATWTNAHSEIKKVLDRHGFTRQQGSVYFGGSTVNAVTCRNIVFNRGLRRKIPSTNSMWS